MSDFSRLSHFLLDLHRGASEIEADGYQHWALERLKVDLPFDTAIWASGAGSDAGPVFHGIHLQHLPAQLLLDYEPLKQHDRLFAQCMATPGISVRADGLADLPALFLPYLTRYGLMQGLCTMTVDEPTALLTGISLYRSDHTQPFSDADVALMNAVFAHLIDTDSRNKLMHLQREARADMHSDGGYASCDDKGLLRYADDRFCRLITQEWPAWQGPWLPDALKPMVARPQLNVPLGRASISSSKSLGVLWLLQLRRRRLQDELPPRLREVADLAMQGLSHKEIAKQLAIAPGTARNHLAKLYRVIGVTNKTELASRMLDAVNPSIDAHNHLNI
jgi:DNA-binding CsgD family transcriptional regulator